MIFDVTVDYIEEEKGVVHDISVHLSPKAARRPAVQKKVKVKVRRKVRRWTGRYVKRHGRRVRRGGGFQRIYRTVWVTVVKEVTRTVAGGKWTEDDAFKAFWAAHKIVQKGGRLERDLTDWTVEAIDWRKGAGLQYAYGNERATEVLGNMGGILEDKSTKITVKLRVGELEGDE